MNSKKILGALGVVLGIGATIYHVVDPTALPDKWMPIYTVLGTIFALFGKHPASKE